MLVKLENTWFAPSEVEQVDKIRVASGKRYRKGVHDIPERLLPFLPSSAKILDKKPEPVAEDVALTLRDLDELRAAADEVAKKEAQAEKTLTERRRELMAKAREAAKAKREAKE